MPPTDTKKKQKKLVPELHSWSVSSPEAAQRLTWWNAYGPTSGNLSLILAVFSFYEFFISNVFPLCMFFAIFAYTSPCTGAIHRGGILGDESHVALNCMLGKHHLFIFLLVILSDNLGRIAMFFSQFIGVHLTEETKKTKRPNQVIHKQKTNPGL